MPLDSSVQAHQPATQLPLPLDVPRPPTAPMLACRIVPREVWASLSTTARSQLRQTWLDVFQEVANDAHID